jgi:transposase
MQTPLTIGVDVAKDTVSVACAHHTFAPRTLPNERTALLAFLRSLPQGSRLGLEATGHYHELLAALAVKAGFSVFVLNPKDTRHYARGVGLRAKTDRVDAALIARLIEREHDKLHLYRPPTKAPRTLDRLLKRRHKLTTVKGILRQSLTGLSGLGRELQTVLKRIDRLSALIDQRRAELIAQHPKQAQACARLQISSASAPSSAPD